jgi:hypothetical protein
MLVHRFRELLSDSEPFAMSVPAVATAAFVPCPCPMALGMSPWQFAQAAYLYRLAFEQAQAQLAPIGTNRWPAFSLN